MVEPHFKMLWADQIPNYDYTDALGKKTQVEIIAGVLADKKAANPPPDSWASDPKNEVSVWNIQMEPNASWILPSCSPGNNRTLYYYQGDEMHMAQTKIGHYCAVTVAGDVPIELQNGNSEARILLLQGRPIGEPVMQYGPFVMNTKEEINQAFEDYHQTQFGGWPWPKSAQVHARTSGRFALHADGTREVKS